MTNFNNNYSFSSKEQLAPGIWVYRNVIKKEINVIDRLNEIGESAIRDGDSRYEWTFGFVGYSEKRPSYRDCEDIKIGEVVNINSETENLVNDLWRDLKNHQSPAVDDYCGMYNVKMNYWEVMNCIRYGKGQHFQEHADHGFSYSATVSLVGYVNDDYEGGNLYFPKLNLDIKPKAGDLYIFPSTYLFSHRAMPVESGMKFSIVTMLDYNDHAHRPEFMQMRAKWVEEDSKTGKNSYA
jgi:predicted 2-oxoglutarate/Fe(II)-dependent dioxygenase YbiX